MLNYIIANPALVKIDPIATGRRLRAKRRGLFTLEGLSQVFMDCDCPVSVNSIGKWERGVCMPRLEHLFLLSCLYRCSLDELVVGVSESRDFESQDQPVHLKNILLRRTQKGVRLSFSIRGCGHFPGLNDRTLTFSEFHLVEKIIY